MNAGEPFMNGQKEWTPLLEEFGKAVMAPTPATNGHNRFFWMASRIGILFTVLTGMALLGAHYAIANKVDKIEATQSRSIKSQTEVQAAMKDKFEFDKAAVRQLGVYTRMPTAVIRKQVEADKHLEKAAEVLKGKP